jgi:hypothetical protein
MLGEVCESPHYALPDSARSWGSRVVRVGGVCRYLAVGLLSNVRCVEVRPFPSNTPHVFFNSTVIVWGPVLSLTEVTAMYIVPGDFNHQITWNAMRR